MKNLPIQFKILIFLLGTVLVYSALNAVYSPTKELYNKAKILEYSYDRIVQKQVTNYDGYYQVFTDKMVNANINKETFMEVTNIIMTNRKDGQGLAWKWVTENQQIPYSEFTSFYRELSSFIGQRYGDNMIIEEEKQRLVQDHNLLLETFPNNFINSYLKIKPIKYSPGYVTSETKRRFSMK